MFKIKFSFDIDSSDFIIESIDGLNQLKPFLELNTTSAYLSFGSLTVIKNFIENFEIVIRMFKNNRKTTQNLNVALFMITIQNANFIFVKFFLY